MTPCLWSVHKVWISVHSCMVYIPLACQGELIKGSKKAQVVNIVLWSPSLTVCKLCSWKQTSSDRRCTFRISLFIIYLHHLDHSLKWLVCTKYCLELFRVYYHKCLFKNGPDFTWNPAPLLHNHFQCRSETWQCKTTVTLRDLLHLTLKMCINRAVAATK